jgi:hypothetical protein
MDHLAEVARMTKKLEDAKARYEDAMRARNVSIRAARAVRYGPGVIGQAAQMTAEQVRRICQTKD